MAKWLGLATCEFALIQLDADIDEIDFLRGGHAETGTAFVTRALNGIPWGGSEGELSRILNPEAVSGIVVFDTWTRNADRCAPPKFNRAPNLGNVFLLIDESRPRDARQLVAIDHDHCFAAAAELTPRVANVDAVKDDQLYGLFPGFRKYVREDSVDFFLQRLLTLKSDFVESLVENIPSDWEVPARARRALSDFILRRAEFVADNFMKAIGRECWPGKFFDTGAK